MAPSASCSNNLRGRMSDGALPGGIDLGGTKIEAIVVDQSNKVLGSARQPTPTSGGPADVAREMAGAMTDAASAAKVQRAQLRGVGVGSPGTVDRAAGHGLPRRNLPAGSSASRWPARCARRSARASRSATTSRSRRRRSSSSARDAPTARCSASSGAPASAAALCSSAGCGWAAAPPARSGTRSSSSTDAAARAGGAAASRRMPVARRWRRRARGHHARGKPTKLLEIVTEHGRDANDELGLGSARSSTAIRSRRDSSSAAIGALGAAIGSAVNLLDLEAVIIGGGLGVRFGAALRRAHRRRDDAAPAASADPPAVLLGGARRPRRRARRGAASPMASPPASRCRVTSAAGESRRRPTARGAPRPRRAAAKPPRAAS